MKGGRGINPKKYTDRMRIFKILGVLLLFTFMSIEVGARGVECTRVYAFGFSASFNDSIVYFTEIQTIDSAYLEGRTHFLVERQEYSAQLKNYFTSIGEEGRTCVIFYATSEKEIMKKYLKLRKEYENPKKGHPRFRVVNVMKDSFVFQAVEPTKSYKDPAEVRKEQKAARKAAKRAAKEATKSQIQQLKR